MAEPLNYIMHIPKTAGLSLQGLVRRRHKEPGTLELVYTQKEVEEGFTDSPRLETVMGHFRFGHHRFSQRDFRYFTFLREPLQQVISHYHYTKDHPEKFADLPEGIENIIDFAQCPYGNNLQTRFISGIDDINGREKEALQTAKRNLDEHFKIVGLSEEFDLSLLMMASELDWNIAYYVKENTGRNRQHYSAPGSAEIEELNKILRYDIELYTYARTIFEKQKSRHPKAVRGLRSFQRNNRVFQKLNPTYIRFKQLLGK